LQTDRVGVQALTRHYAVGPVIDVRLPGNFGLDVGVMYEQIDQQSANVFLVGFNCLTCEDGPYAVTQSQSVSRVGRSWEYPVAIQYHFSAPAMLRPYVEGGHSYNHLSGIFLNPTFIRYNQSAPLPQLVSAPYATNMNRSGFLFGAGVEIKLPLIHLTPGFRYSRYDKVQFPEADFPNQTTFQSPNSLDFLVGINLNSIYRRTDKPKQ
jgi:opacity protein-like surface antigen